MSAEVMNREAQVSSLHERIHAELEGARQLAASAAADRASLAAREKVIERVGDWREVVDRHDNKLHSARASCYGKRTQDNRFISY